MESLELPQTVEVQRESRSTASHTQSFAGYTQVFAAVSCLIEPMGAWRKESIFGNLSGLKYHFTWGTEAILEGDRILYGGKTYVLQVNLDDQYRGENTTIPAYQSGFIEEEVRPRG